MLNSALLHKEVQDYIKKNKNQDLPALILKGSPFENISAQELAVQIKGAKTAEAKFPILSTTEGIFYPPKLNLEQTSSQITAEYKSAMVRGKYGIDLTGGLGIDSYFLSRKFEEFTYFEMNAELAEIAAHNFKQLHAENIQVYHGNSLEKIEASEQTYDCIYSDPARRNEEGGKVFKLEDCEPNIPANLDLLFSRSEQLMIKTSPILDIKAGLRELEFVQEIHIVAIKNEVKELLWILKKGFKGDPTIRTVNFNKKEVQKFSGSMTGNTESALLSTPLTYLYEPNSAIMKSGLFDLLGLEANTKKLHINSHLFTSEELKKFPGRIFQISDIQKYNPSELKKRLKNKKANITTRNFSESVEQLRKRFKIKDGGADYIFFTTNLLEEKIVLFCKKIPLA